jgi:hypothetical protein
MYGDMQVVIRVRPPLSRELQGDKPFQSAVSADPNQQVLQGIALHD